MLSRQQLNDVNEHYAYQLSTKCVKLEDFRLLVGGNCDLHPCTDAETAHDIFNHFEKNQ